MERLRTRACLLMLVVPACHDEPALPPVIWEGEHLRYRTNQPVDSICGGTFAHLDRRAAHIGELFEAGPFVVDYSHVSTDELPVYCPSTSGCADGTAAFSRFALDEHELFHAAHGNVAHRGLEEGLAVAFGDDRKLPDVGGDIDEILQASGRLDLPLLADYPRLGHFVSFLRADFGIEALAELSGRSSIDDGYDELARDIEATLGVPLPETIASYEAEYPICDPWRYRYDGLECGGDGVDMPAEVGEEIMVPMRIDCPDEATLGPRAGEIWRTLALRVPTDGFYRISVVPEPGNSARVRFSECEVSCFDADDAFEFEFEGILLDLGQCLRRGTYQMRMAVDTGDAADLRLEARRLDSEPCG